MAVIQDISDHELAYLVKEDSKEGFRLLYERYASGIQSFAYNYLREKHDAEELVQDVFLKIWEKRATLNHTANVRAFIFKIAINAIYDFIKRKNIQQAFQDFVASTQNTSDETWEQVVHNDMISQINEITAQMPEQRLKIFKLSKEQGLTNEEIAEKMGLSKRTIENQLYRAICYLKKNLKLDSTISSLFFFLL